MAGRTPHDWATAGIVAVLLGGGGWLLRGTVDAGRDARLTAQLAAAEARADSADAEAAAWADSARVASARVSVDTVRLRETVTRWRVSVDTLFREVPATPRESALVTTCDAVVTACEAARDAQAVEAGYLRQTLFAERAGRAADRDGFTLALRDMAAKHARDRRRDRVTFGLGGAAVGVLVWELVR